MPLLAVARRGADRARRSSLVFFVAPEDADQGLSQKIFYFHVPIALTAYACFGWGAWKALLQLWKRGRAPTSRATSRSTRASIFGALTLVTGSIWAKASWGHWWLWSENQLVLFLVLFLFYSAYFMLRFSVEAGPAAREHLAPSTRSSASCSSRSASSRSGSRENFIHPTVFTRDGPQMTGLDVLHVLRLPGRRCSRSRTRCTASSCRQAARRAACASCARR